MIKPTWTISNNKKQELLLPLDPVQRPPTSTKTIKIKQINKFYNL